MTDKLYELIYVSELDPNILLTAVPDITRHARIYNPLQQITGLLVFDGSRFCQQMEGPLNAVRKLFERISLDRRHGEIRMVHEGDMAKSRFRNFNIGYPIGDTGNAIDAIGRLKGAVAVAAFMELVVATHIG